MTNSARRILKARDQEMVEAWLKQLLIVPLHPAMQEGWILDADASIKLIYGKQMGSVVGYNSHKPGRPEIRHRKNQNRQ